MIQGRNSSHRVFIAAYELSQVDKFSITLLDAKEKHRIVSAGIFSVSCISFMLPNASSFTITRSPISYDSYHTQGEYKRDTL